MDCHVAHSAHLRPRKFGMMLQKFGHYIGYLAHSFANDLNVLLSPTDVTHVLSHPAASQ